MSVLHELRRFELDKVRSYFAPNAHVLEIGGGMGFQANLIAALGARVESIDVEPWGDEKDRLHTVKRYGGTAIPYPDNTFDVVFSSNVLEHIADVDTTLKEIVRVLKPDGIAVHVLPTATWRLWTSLGHYAHLFRRLFKLLEKRRVGDREQAEPGPETQQQPPRRNLLARILYEGPHGEYPSALSEIWYFSRARWRRKFEANGMQVTETKPGGLFYTGHALLRHLSIDRRERLAKWLGSSTYIYAMRKS